MSFLLSYENICAHTKCRRFMLKPWKHSVATILHAHAAQAALNILSARNSIFHSFGILVVMVFLVLNSIFAYSSWALSSSSFYTIVFTVVDAMSIVTILFNGKQTPKNGKNTFEWCKKKAKQQHTLMLWQESKFIRLPSEWMLKRLPIHRHHQNPTHFEWKMKKR